MASSSIAHGFNGKQTRCNSRGFGLYHAALSAANHGCKSAERLTGCSHSGLPPVTAFKHPRTRFSQLTYKLATKTRAAHPIQDGITGVTKCKSASTASQQPSPIQLLA